ncbi:MAG: PVC-type heme-binding CxxCH protein [Planctomycetota bacterium]|jgi:putative membrane-bound dehydrogenase-like protein
MRCACLVVLTTFILGGNKAIVAQDNRPKSNRPPAQLEFSKWSGEVNVPDPVAISFDSYGRAYVTQTQRRKAQDLDIRAHRDWVPDDVGFQSVDDKRAFYHRVLAPPTGGKPAGRKRIDDFNKDGVSDYRDLMVISEKIHVVEDSDGDGIADRSSLFAEGFQTEVTGIAAGVLWHDGAVYSTIAPDVWKLRDSNGDGKADQREAIATGFGLHIAYAGHDMHGLTVGPDGKIYWTVGDKGISATSREGRRFHYPNQGGVMRCNPDGSDFEVFAHGLRNVQELAFDDFGNLFGVDNDADQPGERERVVYIVEGSDAGWRCNYQYRGKGYNPWTAEKLWNTHFDGQAAYLMPPLAYSLNGPAGFTFNPGTALSPEYRGYFFLTGAPGGEQRAFQMVPSGAAFKVANEHEIGRGVPLVGINFGPDGALYGVDWGGGYPLNQKGAIWKIDVPGAAGSEARRETAKLLADGFSQREPDQLENLLAHADQRVRLEAQFELVKRRAFGALERLARNTAADRLARFHSIWGLGQLVRTAGADGGSLATLLKDEDAEIRVQALRTITDLDAFDGELIVPLLSDAEPRVQFQAAIALRNHSSEGGLPGLVDLATRLESRNTYLRHAVAYGLSGASSQKLSDLSVHDSTMVRLCAVVALRHQYDAYRTTDRGVFLARFLMDADNAVSSEAARAIYEVIARHGFDPGSVLRAEIERLAATLPDSQNLDEVFVRRAVGAAYLLGTSQAAERVAGLAARADAPADLRQDALDALSEWTQPPLLDRVDGRRRRYERITREAPSAGAIAAITGLFSDRSEAIRAAALKTSRSLRVRFSESALANLASIVTQSGVESELRLQALDTLRSQSYGELGRVLQAGLETDDVRVRMRSLELLSGNPQQALTAIEDVLSKTASLKEQQHAIAILAKLKTEAADARIAAEFAKLVNDEAVAGTELELIEAARARSEANSSLAEALAVFDVRRTEASADDPLAAWSECLTGGDAEAGRETFMTHLTAACIRCHRVGKTGSTVGPNLESIGLQRDRKHLLRAIISPSADIEPKYRTQTLVLASGKVIQGLPLRRTDDVTVLANAQGKEVEVRNEDIDEALEQKTSIMPEMTKTLTRREIRNLVAWLTSQRKPVKAGDGKTP